MFSRAARLLLLLCHVESRLVHAPAGSIQGVPADDGDYVMFLGIPYARVNNSNPFGESIAPEKFDTVFHAYNDSAICPQVRESGTGTTPDAVGGALDCLRLNVYVPAAPTPAPRPVYFYVHGGKFTTGHGARSYYGPRYLVRHDVIVVTFNYRLGPYGFLCTDIPEIPGNQGLKDQYRALEWVRDNIGAFGGDPHNITIGGHSSGAMCVNMHLLTPRPRLFRRAILQSGTATSPGFALLSDTRALVKIANDLGLKTKDSYAALSFLSEASPHAVIKATAGKYDWSACVERDFDGGRPFIAEYPELAEGRDIQGVDILGGFTLRECVYSLYSAAYAAVLGQADPLGYEVNQKFNIGNDSDVVEIVRNFYVGDDKDFESVKYKIVDFLSVFDFVYPIQRELTKFSRRRDTSVYMYLFAYDGRMNRFKRQYNVTERGATHFDEIGYLFTADVIPDRPDADDRRKIDQMTTMWTNFIKYGNPTPQTSELLPVSWPPLAAGAAQCLQIDSDLTVISRPFQKDIAFWDLFYEAHLDKLILAAPKNLLRS